MPVSTQDQIVFFGPSLADLSGNKPVHARPIQYNRPNSDQRSTLHQELKYSNTPLRKRSRPLKEATLHDETIFNSHRPKRSIQRQEEVDEIEDQEAVQLPRSDSVKHTTSLTTSRQHSNNNNEKKNNSFQSRFAPLETSDAETDYATLEEKDEAEQSKESIESITRETKLSIQPISKAERLRLGPARVVGMTRNGTRKAPLLKAIERPAQPTPIETKKQDLVKPESRPISDVGSQSREVTSIGGATTIESIPPPPTHAFSLSHITLISTLISSPNRYLSAYQGGSQHDAALKFNLLALVVRVGPLEDVTDWKSRGKKRMNKCEVIVKDTSDCTLKVMLERECATNWTAPRDEDSFDLDQVSSIDSLVEESQTSSDALLWDSLDASNLYANDGNGSASRTTIERQRDDRLLPIRPGDVVVLSRLYLVRPRSCPKGRSSYSSSHFADINKSISTHAIASPTTGATLELCWRNSVQRRLDQRRNFDKCLTAFDARCRAIYHLAQSWTS